MARSAARRRFASVWKGASPASRRDGSGGTTTDSPVASNAAPGVASGSPARSCVAGVARAPPPASPFSNLSAGSAVSHRPSFVMPMGTTSYFVLSIAFKTDAADSNDTSCSPLRPPKRMPTRSFAMPFQSGARSVFRQSQLWFQPLVSHRRDAEVAEEVLWSLWRKPGRATSSIRVPPRQRRIQRLAPRFIELTLDVPLDALPLRAQRHFLNGELGFVAGIVHAHRQFFVLEAEIDDFREWH